MNINEAYLLPKEVSEITQISESELSRRRQKRDGIPYIKLGHKTIRYKRSDVDAFMDGKLIETKLTLAS